MFKMMLPLISFPVILLGFSSLPPHPQFFKMVEAWLTFYEVNIDLQLSKQKFKPSLEHVFGKAGGFRMRELEQAPVPQWRALTWGRMRAVPQLLRVPSTSHWHLPHQGDIVVIRYSLWRCLRHVHLSLPLGLNGNA